MPREWRTRMNTDTLPPEDSLLTRRSLLSRLRDVNDAAGWREFFDTYWELIYRVARRAGLGDADAQDLVQEVMLSVAKQMPGFRYDPKLGRFKAWLLRVVHRRVADFWRTGVAQRERTVALEDADVEDAPAADFEEVWEAEWREQVLAAALRRVRAKVNVKQFMIFEMAVLREVPVAEIKRGLGVNAAQVYLARHRVGKLLEEELRRVETPR